ncbi:MAG: myxococcus cysteine-rich repeat containing protein [Candidatus Pacearchaeota archaeon]|nr:myxococcus cysteine-rich repeat containing protein [Candidatus Pacearchaeota archaeon]
MKKGALIVFLFLIINLFQLVSADVLSLNSGGDTGLVINPESLIEGFFSGDNVQVLSTCGNGIIESPYEECDDGNYNSGDGCSFSCSVESGYTCTGQPSVCTKSEEPPEPPEPPPTRPGEPYIRIDPNHIRRSMLINSNVEETIGITNLNRTSSTNFSIYSAGFDPDLIVSFWDDKNREWADSFSLIMSASEIYELRVRFSAPNETGFYNGTIFIDGKNASVILNVQEKLLLFDSNIIVLNPDYRVSQGEKLRTSVTLIPLGDKERMDVTLNYVIKDYNGKVYLTRSETVLVEEQVNFKRNFDTGTLPLGSYIIGLELIYSNGVAPSSAHFEVVLGRQSTFFGRIVFFLVNAILIILILIIILIILRIIKQMREKKKKEDREKFLEKLNPKKKEDSKDKEEEKSKEDEKTKGK